LTDILHETSLARPTSDREAARLFAEYGDRLFRYCLGQLRSREEAEDAVQNTFLRVTTAMRKGVVPEFEGPWLYKIARNVCLSRRLGSSRRARVETPADIDALGDRAASYTADADELFNLAEVLADMPSNLRRPFLLREWQGLSYAEIAESLGVSHSAVETSIFRARRHLARALTDSVKRSGRAIASIFPVRWLVEAVRGLVAGAGGIGLAAGTAALVVAIGGGLAIEIEIQGASGARPHATAVATNVGRVAAAPARGGVPARKTVRASSSASAGHQSARPAGARQRARTSGSAGGTAGAPSSGAAPASAGAGTTGSASASTEAAGSTATPPARTSGAGARTSASARPRPSSPPPAGPAPPVAVPSVPSLPAPPPVPDPGDLIPPVSVPSVPPAPPLPDPPAVPPVPTVPPVPPVSLPPAPAPPASPPLPPLPPLPSLGPIVAGDSGATV
jgi:RNA polymerase sigma factor (sigma-70 family)